MNNRINEIATKFSDEISKMFSTHDMVKEFAETFSEALAQELEHRMRWEGKELLGMMLVGQDWQGLEDTIEAASTEMKRRNPKAYTEYVFRGLNGE